MNDLTRLHLKTRTLRLVAASLLATCSMVGVAQAEEAPPARGWHGMHMREGMDPARAGQHLERMIARLVPDATPDQKTRLHAIAKAAMGDLQALREKQRALRGQGMKLLAQPVIDRAAIERLRAEKMQIAEARSKRMSQAWADAAEVLTPAQRAKAAELVGKHHAQMQQRKAS